MTTTRIGEHTVTCQCPATGAYECSVLRGVPDDCGCPKHFKDCTCVCHDACMWCGDVNCDGCHELEYYSDGT